MFVKMLKSKIHRATVTDANVNYVGSITIDRDLLDQAGMAEYEAVLVANLNNGSRHETYVLAGERGSGKIVSNGAAARLVHPGDKVIIFAFGYMEPSEAATHRPTIVVIKDECNKLAETLP